MRQSCATHACCDRGHCADLVASEAAPSCSRTLLERIRQLEAAVERLEHENLHFASMLVASTSLHTTLELDKVLQYVKETLINLIGSEQFGIYLAGDDGREFTLVAHEGLDGWDTSLRREGVIGRAMEGRVPMFASDAELRSGAPLVCIPLTAHDIELGVIAMYRLVDHKHALLPRDYEVIELLAREASGALHIARFYAEHSASVEPALRRGPETALLGR